MDLQKNIQWLIHSIQFIVPLLICLLIPTLLSAQDASFDEYFNELFMPIAVWWENLVFTEVPIFGGVPIVLIMLVLGALFFTLYFGFINLRKFPLSIQIVLGKYDDLETQKDIPDTLISTDGDVHNTIKDEGHYGEVNHFQALATAISGTVGLGNIAMVAVAISLGGPGATFWMIIAGILGMSTKFVECTLGVKYREIDEEGKVYGGPMYYLSKGLKEMGFPKFGKILAYVFALMCVGAALGGGNAFQSNQATAQIINLFEITSSNAGTFLGMFYAVLVGIVIIGGIKRIANVTSKVVPFMALLYVSAALFIILSNFSLIDDAFLLIFQEAFTPRATIAGGMATVMIQGFRRAAFSNEAGAGSAAIAHAAVQTRYPASEGLVALLEPFIDTVLICTMTALVIILFNMDGAFIYGAISNNTVTLVSTGEQVGGVNLTSAAFDAAIPGFSYLLVVAVVLFAFSTILSWFYYGLQSWKFLFGKSKVADLCFKVLFLLFTILGSAITLEAVIKFSDAMILALVFPNMIGLLFLFTKVKAELADYLKRLK